jgi:hypothetical protein
MRDSPEGVPKGGSPSIKGRTGQPDPSRTRRKARYSQKGVFGVPQEAWTPERKSANLQDWQGGPDSQKGVFGLPQGARTAPPRESSDSQMEGVPQGARTSLLQGSPLGGTRQPLWQRTWQQGLGRQDSTWQGGLPPTWTPV